MLIEVPGAKVKVYWWGWLAILVVISVKPPLSGSWPLPMLSSVIYPVGGLSGMIFTAVPTASMFRPGATTSKPSTDVFTATCEKSAVTTVGWHTVVVAVGVAVFVTVAVGVDVLVAVEVKVAVGVDVLVAVFVAVTFGVEVFVAVEVNVAVGPDEFVAVPVGVDVDVKVAVGFVGTLQLSKA